jgi:hypothetical protein
MTADRIVPLGLARLTTLFRRNHLVFRLGSKHVQQLSHEPRLFRLDSFEFAFIEPHAFAVEALVDANTTESDLFELHSAFRALHKVESTLGPGVTSGTSLMETHSRRWLAGRDRVHDVALYDGPGFHG